MSSPPEDANLIAVAGRKIVSRSVTASYSVAKRLRHEILVLAFIGSIPIGIATI